MPNWKKVIVSGSNATLNQVTSSVVRADTNLKIPVYSSNPSAGTLGEGAVFYNSTTDTVNADTGAAIIPVTGPQVLKVL